MIFWKNITCNPPEFILAFNDNPHAYDNDDWYYKRHCSLTYDYDNNDDHMC